MFFFASFSNLNYNFVVIFLHFVKIEKSILKENCFLLQIFLFGLLDWFWSSGKCLMEGFKGDSDWNSLLVSRESVLDIALSAMESYLGSNPKL